MKRILSVFLVIGLVTTLLLSIGCGSTKIGDIKADPAKYEGKEVVVKATAGNSFWIALITRGAYELTDETGSIWVVCGSTPPEKNAIVTVKGTVARAITVGENSLGTVIMEISRD
jgi:hypothetical protein